MRPAWLAIAALAALALALVWPSMSGWYQEDDLRNLRWAMEFGDQPWQAWTHRHPLHGHVRPATLTAFWAGATMSDGAFWGPQVTLLGLLLGGWLGTVALATRLGKSPWAGALTGLLALGQLGFQRLPDWNAWICDAGALCAGLWAMVWAAGPAPARSGWARPGGWMAGALVLLSGAFKEPGFVVAGLACTLLVWTGGGPKASRGAALVPALAGLGGLAATWHSANLDRLPQVPAAWFQRATEGIFAQARRWVDLWPAPPSLPEAPWAGIWLPLLLLGLWGAVRHRPKAALLLLPAGASLLLLLASEVSHSVHALFGAWLVCIVVGVGATALLAAPTARPQHAVMGWILGATILLECAQLGPRLVDPWAPESRANVAAQKAGFLGLAAVGAAHPGLEAEPVGHVPWLDILPMAGIALRPDGAPSLPADSLLLQGGVRVSLDPTWLAASARAAVPGWSLVWAPAGGPGHVADACGHRWAWPGAPAHAGPRGLALHHDAACLPLKGEGVPISGALALPEPRLGLPVLGPSERTLYGAEG